MKTVNRNSWIKYSMASMIMVSFGLMSTGCVHTHRNTNSSMVKPVPQSMYKPDYGKPRPQSGNSGRVQPPNFKPVQNIVVVKPTPMPPPVQVNKNKPAPNYGGGKPQQVKPDKNKPAPPMAQPGNNGNNKPAPNYGGGKLQQVKPDKNKPAPPMAQSNNNGGNKPTKF